MYFVIPLIFSSIFPKYQFKGIQESDTYGDIDVTLQRKNLEIGVMCYILVKKDYITNVNIFKDFNV